MLHCICIVFYNSLKTNSKTQTTILNCSLCKCESFPYEVKTERLRVNSHYPIKNLREKLFMLEKQTNPSSLYSAAFLCYSVKNTQRLTEIFQALTKSCYPVIITLLPK